MMTMLPLSGIRVLDFTVVWAGPYCTMMLADHGAEVIRVESLQHFPSTTRGSMMRPPPAFMANASHLMAGYPDWEPGERPWNRHPMFNCHARNKLSMTVDTSRPEGTDIVRRLVEISDVMVENNPVTTMEKLGLTYETVRQWKDDIIYVSMPPFGHTGPYREFRGYGGNVEALCGLISLRGYADLQERSNARVLYMDAASGAGAAFAVLAALHHRERTGQGQFIDFSHAENMMPHIGGFYMDAAMNGRDATPIGNHHPAMAPHNCYPCQGEDRWLVITVTTDDEWQRLCRALGEPDWAMQTKFATRAGRLHHEAELDRYLSDWTQTQDVRAAMAHLQAHGIAAGMVLFEPDAYDDPQLNARGFFETMTHPECGTHRYPGRLWKMSKTPATFRRPPCCLGEHNAYVYGELLGLSAAEIERLRQAGHIGDTYVDT
jgi:crotonobetainyl-CoA:carnitine CoA-transferase CaiB-like acyl-CoA transferase